MIRATTRYFAFPRVRPKGMRRENALCMASMCVSSSSACTPPPHHHYTLPAFVSSSLYGKIARALSYIRSNRSVYMPLMPIHHLRASSSTSMEILLLFAATLRTITTTLSSVLCQMYNFIARCASSSKIRYWWCRVFPYIIENRIATANNYIWRVSLSSLMV